MRRFKLAGLAGRLRSSYWFLPSLITLGAIGLAVAFVRLDQHLTHLPAGLGWVYAGGAEGARSLLSAVAGSMVTVVSVTFSVTVVALTVSSQHFGPRLLNSFMRDTAAQTVLGVFIATFSYCVVVLRTVRGASEGVATFVPHIAVTFGVALTLLSVGMLIFYVHHVSSSLQVTQIVRGVANDLDAAIRRMYPERIGQPRDDGAAPPRPETAFPVPAPNSGYVQRVDPNALLRWAQTRDAVIWAEVRPGEFVGEGAPLAFTTSADDPAEIAEAYVIGNDRTPEQDAGFAVQQLVEVALHALSPGINEPFTAVTCIDWLGQGLACLTSRGLPPACRADGTGRLRVVAHPYSFAELLEAAFRPLREPAGALPTVAEHLLTTLATLARRSDAPAHLAAIAAEIEAAHGAASRQARDAGDRKTLDEARHRANAAVSASLARGRDPRQTP
jgi:uncharacterized membrane protein